MVVERKKYKRKTKRLSSLYRRVIGPGLESFHLCRETQIFLECRIGKHVLMLSPWVFISKEKILDHISLYEENSEFFNIREKIEKFPGSKMMVGSNTFDEKKPVLFYICTTLDAQERMLAHIKKNEEKIRQRVRKSVFRPTRKWESLGSEEQVMAEMILYLRIPLAIDIETDYPIHKGAVCFQIIRAEDLSNGYIELTAKRPPEMQFFWRRRLEKGAQATGLKQHKTVQTEVKMCRQQGTEYVTPRSTGYTMTVELSKDLDNFFHLWESTLSDLLVGNFHINPFQQDYADLFEGKTSLLFNKPADIKQFKDVSSCPGTEVSCISWNSMIAGIVAASYSKNPLFSVTMNRRPEIKNPELERHLILIWFYQDSVRPKLYLHARTEVTALSFCPYDENILVAGYINGLIAVWDLTERLAEFTKLRPRSVNEQKYHEQIFSWTGWFRRPLNLENVFPVVTSRYQSKDTSPVTSINWIPPNHYISDRGLFTKSAKRAKHMQFLTVSLEGNNILVWDLKVAAEQGGLRNKKQPQSRLASAPTALIQNVSPLTKLEKFFNPVFSLLLNESRNGKNKNPLMKMVLQTELFHYVPINPEALDKIESFTYFDMDEPSYDSNIPQRIIFSTGLGVIQVAVVDVVSYKKGSQVVLQLETFAAVHDGPIMVCEMNRFFPDVILTVGGSVFAVWDCTKTTSALVWRKSETSYHSGMWCFHQPLSILVIGSNRCFEFWDLAELSNRPMELFRYSGYDMLKFFADSTKFHARKNTFITTDALGTFKLSSLPSEETEESEDVLQRATMTLERLHQFRLYIKRLKASCRAKMGNKEEVDSPFQSVVVMPQRTSIVPDEVPSQIPKLSNKEQFERKLEDHVQFVCFERKQLNIIEIRKNHIMCLKEEKRRKLTKKSTDDKVTRMCDKLFANAVLAYKVRTMFTVTLTNENVAVLKKRYIDSFQDIEEGVLKTVPRYHFNPSITLRDRFRIIRRQNYLLAHRKAMELKRGNIRDTKKAVF